MKVLKTEDVITAITSLDGLCMAEKINEGSKVYITGGAALPLKKKPIPRPTTDVDVLETSKEIELLLPGTGLNTDVRTFLFQFPDGWRNRAKRLQGFDFFHFDVLLLSNEDIIISKLIAWRDQDQQDVDWLATNKLVDWDALDRIMNNPTEVQIGLDEETWQQVKARYEKLRRKHATKARPSKMA